MLRNGDVWVIVPTYNEAPVVRGVLEACWNSSRTWLPSMTAAPTGRRPRSVPPVRGWCATRSTWGRRSLQTGIDFALMDPDARYFVTFDADGQHRVADAVAMVDHIRDSSTDVLLGSRFLGEAINMSRSRRLLLIAGRWFERLSTGITLTDSHNGLRVFNRSFAQVLNLRMTDMAWATEFLTRAVSTGATVDEFPVTIDYTEYSRSKGQHSINSINIGMDILLNRFLRGPH